MAKPKHAQHNNDTAPKPAVVKLTQAQRRAESEKNILDAAAHLFAQQGYQKTTVQQVAAQAGCSVGLMSHRFGSKRNLLEAVINWIASNLLQERMQPAGTDASASVAIENYTRIYLDEFYSHPVRVRAMYVLLGEGLTLEESIQAGVAKLNLGFRDLFVDLINGGINNQEYPKKTNATLIATSIVGILRGHMLNALVDADNFDISQSIEHIVISIKAILPR